MLLNAGACQLLDQRDNVGFSPLAYATHAKCLEAVRLLVEADCALHVRGSFSLAGDFRVAFTSDILFEATQRSSFEIVKYLVEALSDRRKRLATIALQHLPCKARQFLDLSGDTVLDADALLVAELLAKHDVAVPSSLHVPDDWKTIYHLLVNFLTRIDQSITLKGCAELFYNAGFRDVHRVDDRNKSLLMMNILTYLDTSSPKEVAQFYLWLISKGLRLDHKSLRLTELGEQVPHLPAALHVSRALIGCIGRHQVEASDRLSETPWPERLEDEEVCILLRMLVDETVTDDCICACSLHGCSALTEILKTTGSWVHWLESHYPGVDRGAARHILNYLIRWLDRAKTDTWEGFTTDVIRFMTFQRLLLTHTCCTWTEGYIFGDFVIFNDEDRDNIREEESEDLTQLESLMEEFEEAFNELKLPLPEFLEQYWEPTMAEVMQPGEVDEDSAAKIAELGVVLQPIQTPNRGPTLPTIRRFRPRGTKDLSSSSGSVQTPTTSGHKHRRRNSC
ncbi:hypothetical protein G647_03568 [Cladophialophora carrionii CBS 160.54]|uniref:Uncharacterized protein n=1 Tax=Cladophialophora carrionii CBS 160.54 TaxID=1279043 RepID=V9DBA7_9EURO|nr:uncharacterized protein G647_03568 [Cladophialophora carrionii CBS 160.54]ETI24199.1 hypothetical protein G647_03568 [Cladophialophora carrionii CBS 160.54]